ncbi:cytochrome P450 6j1-like isoform X2 [Rhodnius prolixus]
MLLVRDPELSKIIHIKEFNNFADNGFVVITDVDPMLGINPFAIKGIPEWKDIRGIHTPLQTTIKLKTMIPEMANIAENLIKYIDTIKDKPIEVKDTTRFYTNDVVASCAYGIQSDSFFENSSFNKYTMKQMFGSDYNASYATISGLFLPSASRLFRFRTISATAQKFFETLAKTCIQHREESGKTRNDLIQHLMSLNQKNLQENKSAFSEVELAAHCMTFFINGAETASIQLTFTLFELAVNSDVQEKLRNEIKQAVNNVREFDYDKLWGLPYLEMVISESLRLHPPLPFVSRTCTQQTILGGLEINAGTKVFTSILGLHKDAEYYPEPEKFNPERFSEENKGSLNKDAYLPFGEGPRRCLGAKFALTENKMALAAILLNYRLKPADDIPVMNYDEKSTFFTSPKGKINIIFERL